MARDMVLPKLGQAQASERKLFNRLAVFAGSWTLEAVVPVARPTTC
jgi:hypothetical protein